MKKSVILSLTMAGALSLAVLGCGKNEAQVDGSLFETTEDSVTSDETERKQNQDKDLNAGSGNDLENDANAATKINTDALINIVSHKVTCEANGDVLAEGSYPEIILSDEFKEKYPKLKIEIDSQNSFWRSFAKDSVSEYAGYKTTDEIDTGYPYTSEAAAEVLRADDRIFTVYESKYDYSGGAHPNHWGSTLNIDPVTGKHLEFQDVLKDTKKTAEAMKEVLYETYPDMTDEFDSFIYCADGQTVADAFEDTIYNDTFTWALLPEGLKIFFSPYEIASYAAGEFEILLPYDKYPDLVQTAYVPTDSFDKEKMVAVSEGFAEQVEVIIPEEFSAITVPNKSWSSYTEDGRGMDDGEHVTISKISEEKTDWLDTEVWADKNGFEVASLPYSDEKYIYEGYNPMEYEYMNCGLKIYDAATNLPLYDLDLYTLCNGPDEETDTYSATTQYIRWAKIYDGTLYVSVGHNGYASVEPKSSYIVAIAPDTGYVLWRSEPLVSNANNFQIVKDTIICGYGFTAEDDFIYLLDRFTGQRMDKIKVNSGPDQFEVSGDTLYVATYNTAYEFKIE